MELQACLTFSDMDELRKFKKLHFCVEGKINVCHLLKVKMHQR